MQKYQEWKNWNPENFASASKEENLYFSKIRKKFKLAESLNVLEIGFGNGSFFDYSKSIGWSISGIELIPNLREIAEKNGFDTYKSISDLNNKVKFDLIVAFDVVEHIDSEDLVDFLKKIHNLLKSNGLFIMRVPNGSSPLGLANQHGDVTHRNIITESKMEFWAKSANLRINYRGGDFYLIYNGEIIKTPIRILKRTLQLFIERLLRWIFSPQSKGILSANTVYVLTKINHES
jgi:SAM-dependent methyltransferase